MTDPRRATIPDSELARAIIHELHLGASPKRLRIIAAVLGIIPSDYDTSADAGEPVPMAFGKPMTPISEADLIRKMMDPDSPVIRAQKAAVAASRTA